MATNNLNTPRFSIVIPTYSNSVGVFECLDSIIKHTDLSETEILVVANGAPEATGRIAETYREYPVKLIWIPEACGYTHACNVGMEAAQGDYIVLLNDDVVILGSQWLPLLYEPFSDPRMAVTGPLLLNAPETKRDFLVFFCVMISRAVMDEIGNLDEVFNPGYAEDCDYCHRAEDAGWKIQQVPSGQATLVDKGCEDLPQWKRDKMWTNNFPVYHDGNKTFGADPKFAGLIKRNSAILAERYAPKLSRPTCPTCGATYDKICVPCTEKSEDLTLWRAHAVDGWFNADEGAWLAAQVKGLPPNSKVLEVGSWHGRSSRFIADNLSDGSQCICVDSWNGSSGEPDAHLTAQQREGDHAHSWWWCNLHEHIVAGRVIPMREHSANAAETLGHLIEKGEMEKFDLIFIDGDHSAEGIKTDVEAWLPLLKEGGLLCGHDYYKENEGPWWVHVRQYVETKFPNVQKSATSIWHVRPHEQADGPHVYDCFLFSNELDVLEIRLATLYDHVDRFVLVESETTHAGQPKPLYFDLNKERFAKYLDKITHIVTDLPTSEGSIYDQAWARERAQRDACLIGLKNCKSTDIVIIGDADEIASPSAIAAYRNWYDGEIVRLKQRMFYYYLNCENKDGWDWQKIARYSEVKRLTPCGIRYPPAGELPLLEQGGWHFSFLSPDAEGVAAKVRGYSHQEFNRPEITDLDHVRKCMAEGVDLYGRDLQYEFVDIDNTWPHYVYVNTRELLEKGLIKSPKPIVTAIGTDMQPRGAKFARVDPNAPLVFDDGPLTVTATVSTKDRYETTLPMCIAAIANQTRKPDKLVIYDDGEQKDIRELAPFNGLLRMLDSLGVKWEIHTTPRAGQVANHQHALDCATTDLVWRVDDDEIPAPDCLANLLACMGDDVGAVAGLVHHPDNVHPLPPVVDGSLHDLSLNTNLQWFAWTGEPREVAHLYSTFLYRVEAARQAGGYCLDLSPVGHREETLFTHSIKRAGWKLLVTPAALTWHLREATGGIRAHTDATMWERDEKIFQGRMETWGIVPSGSRILVLDCGLGDHLLFRKLLPEIRRRNEGKRLTLAVCHPAVFEGEPEQLISIAQAKALLNGNYDDHLLYSWMWANEWKGSLWDAMLEFWGA